MSVSIFIESLLIMVTDSPLYVYAKNLIASILTYIVLVTLSLLALHSNEPIAEYAYSDRDVCVAIILFVSGAVTLFVHAIANSRNRNILSTGMDKTAVEHKLQREITEAANHEMGMPVALIKALTSDLQQRLERDLSILDTDIGCNRGCPAVEGVRSSIYNDTLQYFSKVDMAVARLESVLAQMSNNKHLKYSNGDTDIYKLISNVIDNSNAFRVHKIKADYSGLDILTTCAVGGRLKNGDLLNIIDNHVTNAVEAMANSIKFTCNKVEDNTNAIVLYISDNGNGIRNPDNKIISARDAKLIFTPGYSTKDLSFLTCLRSPENDISIFTKIYNYITKQDACRSTRGVGLYLSSEIIKRGGGNIELIDTSEYGTTFKLVIPIKKLETPS